MKYDILNYSGGYVIKGKINEVKKQVIALLALTVSKYIDYFKPVEE